MAYTTIKCIIFALLVAVVLGKGSKSTPEPTAPPKPTIQLTGIIRDQAPNTIDYPGKANGGKGWEGTDFEYKTGDDYGIVGTVCNKNNGWNAPKCSLIGSDQTPVYAWGNSASKGGTVHNAASFRNWFHDSYQTVKLNLTVTLSQSDDGTYQFHDTNYYPLDNKGWNDSAVASDKLRHNFGFCLELHSRFGYHGGGEVFKFTGDDDVFVYLDGRLMLDLGGVHNAIDGQINLGDIPDFVVGQNYRFDMFYCERHTVESNLQLTTSLSFYCSYYDWCGQCEGTGASCCTPDVITTYCNDGDPCTIDGCWAQVDPTKPPHNCTHTKIICDKPNACQLPDHTCSADGTCQYTPRVCGVDDACTKWTCDNQLGCQKITTKCDDGKMCTSDTCDPKIGCVHTDISATCNTGNKCQRDSCDNTTGCMHQNITSSCYKDNCHKFTCSPSTGCDNTPIANCTLCLQNKCNNTDPCNDPHQCDTKGVCQKATPVFCDDNNKCTNDKCAVVNGTATCQFIPKQCSNDPCAPEECNKDTGNCEPLPTESCDDGSQCTTDTKTCTPTGNVCNYTANTMCDDDDVCTNDFCNGTAPVGTGACSYLNITCPTPTVCQVALPCDKSKGCQVAPLVCPAAADQCSNSTCDPIAGCIMTRKVCPVDDVNCYDGVCDPTTGQCTRAKKSNFNSATSTNGIKCVLRYNKAIKAAAIGAGAAAGIAIAAAAFIGLAGFGGKKGYDLYQAHQTLKNSKIEDNPLYEATNQNSDNPLYNRNSVSM